MQRLVQQHHAGQDGPSGKMPGIGRMIGCDSQRQDRSVMPGCPCDGFRLQAGQQSLGALVGQLARWHCAAGHRQTAAGAAKRRDRCVRAGPASVRRASMPVPPPARSGGVRFPRLLIVVRRQEKAAVLHARDGVELVIEIRQRGPFAGNVDQIGMAAMEQEMARVAASPSSITSLSAGRCLDVPALGPDHLALATQANRPRTSAKPRQPWCGGTRAGRFRCSRKSRARAQRSGPPPMRQIGRQRRGGG